MLIRSPHTCNCHQMHTRVRYPHVCHHETRPQGSSEPAAPRSLWRPPQWRQRVLARNRTGHDTLPFTECPAPRKNLWCNLILCRIATVGVGDRHIGHQRRHKLFVQATKGCGNPNFHQCARCAAGPASLTGSLACCAPFNKARRCRRLRERVAPGTKCQESHGSPGMCYLEQHVLEQHYQLAVRAHD